MSPALLWFQTALWALTCVARGTQDWHAFCLHLRDEAFSAPYPSRLKGLTAQCFESSCAYPGQLHILSKLEVMCLMTFLGRTSDRIKIAWVQILLRVKLEMDQMNVTSFMRSLSFWHELLWQTQNSSALLKFLYFSCSPHAERFVGQNWYF